MKSTELIAILGLLTLLFVILFGIIWSYFAEKWGYNKGICPLCGGKLNLFDIDSQGGRGYMCDECGYTTWVTSHRIDKPGKKK